MEDASKINPARFGVHATLLATMCRICYLVPHPNSDTAMGEFSAFQGFGEKFLCTTNLLSLIPYCPADAREIYSSRAHVVPLRAIGHLPYEVIPIEVQYLKQSLEYVPGPFRCVLSISELSVEVEEMLADVNIPTLHISEIKTGTAATPDDLDDDLFDRYFKTTIAKLSADPRYAIVTKGLREALSSPRRGRPAKVNLPSAMHNVTAPNEWALRSIHLELSGENPLTPRLKKDQASQDQIADDSKYINAICKSADFVDRARREALGHVNGAIRRDIPLNSVIATAGIYPWALKIARAEGGEGRSIKRVAKLLRLQEGYSISTSNDSEKDILLSELGRSVMFLRAQESRAFTVGLGIRAASQLVPVFRLPQFSSHFRWSLNRVAGSARSDSSPNKQKKLNRLVRDLKKDLQSWIPREILDRVLTMSGNVKIVSDWPLEWTNVEGLPFYLRNNCSRIPATPGNLMMIEMLLNREMEISIEAFNEVLVIRSFGAEDPIRELLERAISGFLEGPQEKEFVVVRFVDVSNVEELINALNSYSGGLVIFDCHGTYDSTSLVGSLIIGGMPLDIWSLKGKVHLPPIALLSACDTHSIDGSHASVANGMLMLGAKSVLGTLLPVSARHSARFIARLLFRIREFIPIVVRDMDKKIRWIDVVAGLQRMNYVTEVLEEISKDNRFWITPDQRDEVQLLANTHINNADQDWWRRVKEKITSILCVDMNQLNEKLEEKCQLLETMKYVQLGNPESIVIMNETYKAEVEVVKKKTRDMQLT